MNQREQRKLTIKGRRKRMFKTTKIYLLVLVGFVSLQIWIYLILKIRSSRLRISKESRCILCFEPVPHPFSASSLVNLLHSENCHQQLLCTVKIVINTFQNWCSMLFNNQQMGRLRRFYAKLEIRKSVYETKQRYKNTHAFMYLQSIVALLNS